MRFPFKESKIAADIGDSVALVCSAEGFPLNVTWNKNKLGSTTVIKRKIPKYYTGSQKSVFRDLKSRIFLCLGAHSPNPCSTWSKWSQDEIAHSGYMEGSKGALDSRFSRRNGAVHLAPLTP